MVALAEGTAEGDEGDRRAASKQVSEDKTQTLQRALANMRSKVRRYPCSMQLEFDFDQRCGTYMKHLMRAVCASPFYMDSARSVSFDTLS